MDTDKAGWLARTKALGGRFMLVTDRCHSAALAAPGLLLRIRVPADSASATEEVEAASVVSTNLLNLYPRVAGLGRPISPLP